jgi:lysyl-tRNA synthetase class 2
MPSQLASWVARLVQLTGLINIISAVLPASRARLRALTEVVPIVDVHTAGAVTAAVGVLLVFLGYGLRRRKRRAWYVATALAAATVGLNIVKGLDVEEAALTAGILVLLLATRRQFYAAADPTSRWRALAAIVGFSVAGVLLGVAELAVRQHHLVGHPTLREMAAHALLGLIGVTGPVHFRNPAMGEIVTLTTGSLGLLAVGSGLLLLLRPGVRGPAKSVEDEQKLRGLLDKHGERDSLGYFALRHDKSLIWSPTGKAAVAYRVVQGVSLASGDPVGDPEAWPGAIKAWLEDARLHAWVPAVLGCGELAGRTYQRHGLDAVELGDEAIVEVADFSLDGRPMRGVRQAVARVERAGYRCEIAYQRDLSATCLATAARAAEDLRDGDVERGFSMALSRFADPADDDCLVVLAWDPTGTLRGLLQFVPWGKDGLSLDLMRRDPASDNGLVEFMIVSAIRHAPALGVRRLSLNFAVLRSVFERGEKLGAGPILRVWHRLLLTASRFWQIESLYRANAKYRPAWRPRYLCFPSARDLPRIGLAALSAEAFLVVPSPIRKLSRMLNRRPAAKAGALPGPEGDDPAGDEPAGEDPAGTASTGPGSQSASPGAGAAAGGKRWLGRNPQPAKGGGVKVAGSATAAREPAVGAPAGSSSGPADKTGVRQWRGRVMSRSAR